MERQLRPFPTAPLTQAPEDSPAPDYVHLNQPIKRPKKSGNNLKFGIAAGIFLVLIILAGGIYELHKHSESKKTPTTHSSIVQPSQSANSNQPSTTGQYVSNGQDLNLNFSYPSNWSVTPPSNDNASDQTITITSPLVSLANASGATVTGKVVVSIRPGSSPINELNSGNATASQASIQIGYSNPLPTQQQYPYLTFINLSGGKDPSGTFDEVMITGLTQFTQGGSVTPSTLGPLDPIISASFYSCTTQSCSGSGEAPLSITYSTWQDTQVFQQVLSLFQSLQLH